MQKAKAAASNERPDAVWAILLCFFASGVSGLVYQVIWVRELVLVFGATTFAVSTVLTAFMGGLALGSYYFGRRSETVQRPLRLYGLLEIGIGLYGLAVPVIFAALPGGLSLLLEVATLIFRLEHRQVCVRHPGVDYPDGADGCNAARTVELLCSRHRSNRLARRLALRPEHLRRGAWRGGHRFCADPRLGHESRHNHSRGVEHSSRGGCPDRFPQGRGRASTSRNARRTN